MKRVISRLSLTLLFSFVMLMRHTFAIETREGVKSEFAFRRQQHRETRRLARTSPHAQSQPDDFIDNEGWSGAVQAPPFAGDKFNGIKAQWIVPTLDRPPQTSGAGFWTNTVWVGIDGTPACNGGILQGGTFSYVRVDDAGTVTTESELLVEWWPSPVKVLDYDVVAGDSVSVSVTATSLSEGTITVNNLSTGKTTTKSLSSPSSDRNICGLTADWIVEDALDGGPGNFFPFAQFSTVTFESCEATTNSGAAVDLNGAELYQITQNNVPLATPTVVSASSMNVVYG